MDSCLLMLAVGRGEVAETRLPKTAGRQASGSRRLVSAVPTRQIDSRAVVITSPICSSLEAFTAADQALVVQAGGALDVVADDAS